MLLDPLTISIALALILVIIHYTAEKIKIRDRPDLLSFSAGISITYIFLYVMPKVFKTDEIAFLFMLIGFTIIRIIEVHAAKHLIKRKRLEEIHTIQSGIFFIYHIIIGFAVFEVFSQNLINGILFAFPILLYTAINSISLNSLKMWSKTNNVRKLILSSSTLIGVLIAYFFTVDKYIIDASLGIVIGSILYIVIKDSMPKLSEGRPVYFLLGIILYIILINSLLHILG